MVTGSQLSDGHMHTQVTTCVFPPPTGHCHLLVIPMLIDALFDRFVRRLRKSKRQEYDEFSSLPNRMKTGGPRFPFLDQSTKRSVVLKVNQNERPRDTAMACSMARKTLL